MNKKKYWVHFSGGGGKFLFTESEQSIENLHWYKALRNAHKDKHVVVTCLCKSLDKTTIKRRLTVSYSEKRNKFWLSARDYTGPEHRQDCRFHSVWTNKILAKGYSSGVLVANKDNTVTVKLPIGINTQSNPSLEDNKKPQNSSKAGNSRSVITLLGLTHYLWEKAKINVWRPEFDKKRTYKWFAERLNHQAKHIKVGKTALHNVLLLNANKGEEQAKINKNRANNAKKNNQRLIIISFLPFDHEKALSSIKSGRLLLSSPYGFPTLEIGNAVFDKTQRSFAREISHWKNGKKVIAIIQTEPPVNYSKAEVISMQLMAVTKRYIPIDSALEERLEEKLYDETRCFIKPLRYDLSEGVLPDFILTDTASDNTPMEVFGMDHAKYLERREEKIQFYNEQYGETGWWSWDATKQDTIPDLPPKVISEV
ncbi:DUF1173 family protein [Providencia rettgeri]